MSDNHDNHHIVPLSYYYYTLGGLLVLTALTVGVSYMHFGSTAANLAVAMAIACAKASLVLLIFMGMKWDSFLNRMTMIGTVGGLATFFFFVGADLGYREEWDAGTKYAEVKSTAAAVSMAQIEEWEKSSPDLVAKGKEIYTGMGGCATCHGNNGGGDGIAGAALNPKPRNFGDKSSTWTNGTSVKSLYVTLSNGIKGTGMAGYQAMLSPEDRLALSHFIRTMVPDPQDSGKVDGQYAGILKDKDGVGAGGAGAGSKGIPIDFAIDQMLEEKKN